MINLINLAECRVTNEIQTKNRRMDGLTQGWAGTIFNSFGKISGQKRKEQFKEMNKKWMDGLTQDWALGGRRTR